MVWTQLIWSALAPMPGADARLGLYVADTHEHRFFGRQHVLDTQTPQLINR